MRYSRWSVFMVPVALALRVSLAQPGSLNPTSAPGPIMCTLEEIYRQLLVTQHRVSDLEQQLKAAGHLPASSGDMVLIPAGTFVMGANTNIGHESYAGETPQHSVSISAFYMDKYEVTFTLWQDVYRWATNHGYTFQYEGAGKGPDHPAQKVNWYDAVTWCNARSQRDGFIPCYTNENGSVHTNGLFVTGGCNWSANGYRLPTEAEWEKAARGGVTNQRFPWAGAQTIQHTRANYYSDPSTNAFDTSPTPGFHPTYLSGDFPYTSPVGAFAPNGYGLYDMSGNVSEWCWDWWNVNYYLDSPVDNPTGPDGIHLCRILRGGSWGWYSKDTRCAARFSYGWPDMVDNSFGFRCARRP